MKLIRVISLAACFIVAFSAAASAQETQRRVVVEPLTENWRKIRDVNGDESWVYKAGLSGERSVIALKEAPIYKRADKDSPVVAIADKQALLRLEDCNKALCRVYSSSGIRGWIDNGALWGAAPLF